MIMKTLKKMMITVGLFCITLANYANDLDANTLIYNIKNVKVVFENVKKGNQLKLKDANNQELHLEYITKQGVLEKTFDLSFLANGSYYFELNKDFEIVKQFFTISNNNVAFAIDFEKVTFKPIIKVEKNLVYVSKLNFDEQFVNLQIAYNNDVIFDEVTTENKIFQRIYKLDMLKRGNYVIQLKTMNETHYYYFNF